MICPYCKKKIADGSKFCRGCGKNIQETRVEKGLKSLLRRVSKLVVVEIVLALAVIIAGSLVFTLVIFPRMRQEAELKMRAREEKNRREQECKDYKRSIIDGYVKMEYLKASVESWKIQEDKKDGTKKPFVVVKLENLGPYPILEARGAIYCREFIDRFGEKKPNPVELFNVETDYEYQPLSPRGERETAHLVTNCISDLEGEFLREISVDVSSVELKWDVKPMYGFEPPPSGCVEY